MLLPSCTASFLQTTTFFRRAHFMKCFCCCPRACHCDCGWDWPFVVLENVALEKTSGGRANNDFLHSNSLRRRGGLSQMVRDPPSNGHQDA